MVSTETPGVGDHLLLRCVACQYGAHTSLHERDATNPPS